MTTMNLSCAVNAIKHLKEEFENASEYLEHYKEKYKPEYS
jgi:hypothetical protein